MEGFYEQLKSSLHCQNRAYNELTDSNHTVNYDVYDMIEYLSATFGIVVTIFKISDEEPSIENPIYGFVITTNGVNGNPLAYKSTDLYYTEFNASCHALSIIIHYLDDGRNNKVQNG